MTVRESDMECGGIGKGKKDGNDEDWMHMIQYCTLEQDGAGPGLGGCEERWRTTGADGPNWGIFPIWIVGGSN
jgi:hypothetical protein